MSEPSATIHGDHVHTVDRDGYHEDFYLDDGADRKHVKRAYPALWAQIQARRRRC